MESKQINKIKQDLERVINASCDKDGLELSVLEFVPITGQEDGRRNRRLVTDDPLNESEWKSLSEISFGKWSSTIKRILEKRNPLVTSRDVQNIKEYSEGWALLNFVRYTNSKLRQAQLDLILVKEVRASRCCDGPYVFRRTVGGKDKKGLIVRAKITI